MLEEVHPWEFTISTHFLLSLFLHLDKDVVSQLPALAAMRCLPSHYGLFLSRAISQNSFFLKLLLVMLLYHGNKEVTEADTQQGIRKSQMSYSRKRGAALGWGVLAGLPSSNGLFTETKRKFLKMASAVQALPCQRHHLSQDHVNVTIEEIRLGVNSSYQPRKLG